MKALVNNPKYWAMLEEHLENELDTVKTQLTYPRNSDPITLYRLQGEANALNSLLSLKDKTNAK